MSTATRFLSADELVHFFGDQAYHMGVRMAVEFMRKGDKDACRALAASNIELIRRGYNKHPLDPALASPSATAEELQPTDVSTEERQSQSEKQQ